jgi:pyruvate dehydrogenase E2 component (dihydrolipoamide acetyltransferase)
MTTVQMPQLGETIIEGTILKWLKREGESIERDEPLFEISTDKVDTEVPSPVAGTVSKILVPEGQTVAVGTDLAQIDGQGEAAGSGYAGDAAPGESTGDGEAQPPEAATADGSAEAAAEGSGPDSPAAEPASPAAAASGVATAAPSPPRATRQASAQPATPSPASGPRSQILSPVVRRLAADHGIDLNQVSGTGTGGRITRRDVETFVAAGGPSGTVEAGPSTSTAAPALQPAPSPAVAGPGQDVVPMTHIRKAIASHMLGSVQTSARAWTMVEVDVEQLVRLRDRAKGRFEEKYGAKLTYLPFVVRATVDALLEYPMVNARLAGEDLVMHRYVNMGIAVSYDQGLIVPVIRGADGMNSVGIARSIADLAARARAHQLRPDEVQDATFTITNPGPYGSLASVPIINQPNTGILSLDGIQKRAVVVDDAIAIRHMVYISMSWDHRVIDGEVATRFLARVKHNLESWDFAEDLGI